MNETFRNPRSAGSSSIDSSPAFCAGEIADGSGCHGRLQQIVCQSLETGLEGGWRRGTPPQTESRSQAQIERSAATAAAVRLEAGHCAVGLRARWLDRPASAGLDPASVRRAVPRRLRGDVAPQARLESAEAG